MRFHLFGIKFELSYIFFAFLTIFIGTDRTGLLLPLILTIAAHEAAHIITLMLFGAKVREINLKVGLLGVVYGDTLSKFEKVLSLFAGPLSNILLAGLFAYYGFAELWAINIILGFYNLLPLSGLDGGAIIEILLSGLLSEKTVKIILNTVAVVMSAASVLLFIFLYRKKITNYSILLFSIYLISPIIVKKLLKESRN